MAAKKRDRSRKNRPAEWPTPRERPHTPAPDVRTGKGAKTVVSPLSGGTIVAGGHPANTGGKKGRSGRKPRLFLEMCKQVIEDPRIGDMALGHLTNPYTKPSEFAAVLGTLASYVHEKPKTTIEHKGKFSLEDLVELSHEEEKKL